MLASTSSGAKPAGLLATPPSELGPAAKKTMASLARSYLETPHMPIQRLKVLWHHNKDTVVDVQSELGLLLITLSSCLQDDPVEYLSNELWNASIESGLLFALLDMITDSCFTRQSYLWIESVLAINASFSKMLMTTDHPRAILPGAWPAPPQSTVKAYLQQQSSVWDALWRERDTLFSESPLPSPNRIEQIIVFASAVASVHVHVYPEYKKNLLSMPSVLWVSLASWTHIATTPSPSITPIPAQYMMAFQVINNWRECFSRPSGLRDPLVVSNANLWRDTIDPVMEAVGPHKFMRACCAALLSWPCVVGPTLLDFLNGLHHIVAIRKSLGEAISEEALAQPIRRAFWESPMLKAVAQALDREASSTVPQIVQHPVFDLNMAVASCWMLNATLDGVVYRRGNPAVCDGQSMYKVLSHCLRIICRKYGDKDNEKFREDHAANIFCGICAGCADFCNKDAALPSKVQNRSLHRIQEGVAAAARAAWYTDIHFLRSFREQLAGHAGYNRLIQSWIEFGKPFGLEETVQRDQHSARNKNMCSWFGCEYHMKPASKSMSTCVGCGEQKYCSRDCQKRDWKQGGHREKCRRMKS